MDKLKQWIGIGSSSSDKDAPPIKEYVPPPPPEPTFPFPLTATLERPVTAVVIGAGCRGAGYARYALERPDLLTIVGVVEPGDATRENFLREHKDVPDDNVFTDWSEAAEREKFADCAIIATPDRLHKAPAVAFAKRGYHILLEKPMAVSEEDCRSIVETCKESNVILSVCHVMRYLPLTQKIKKLIDDKTIGEVVNIQLTEPVGYWHFAHSYVRGNWHKESDSTFVLMAKSCHDIDLINYWMSPHRCVKVSSFGNLAHFNKNDKPEGAGSRCVECSIEEDCVYSAKKLYMTGNRGWPVNVITNGKPVDIENIGEALRTGPYGECVYESDNDVMSNQVVQFEYDGNRLATFTMIAFTAAVCLREVHIYGTKGELHAALSGNHHITHKDFLTGKTKTYEDDRSDETVMSQVRGHGGADFYLINNFIDAVAHNSEARVLTGADVTLDSHLLVFAAERARKENRVITL